MTGFVRLTPRAALRNLRTSPIDSMYSTMLCVVRIVGEIVDQVGEIDVEHRADADEAAEADVRFDAPSRGWRCK